MLLPRCLLVARYILVCAGGCCEPSVAEMRENAARGIKDDCRGDENGDGNPVLLSPSLFDSQSDEDVRAGLLASTSMLYAALAADMRSFSLVSDDFIPCFPRAFGDGGKYAGKQGVGWLRLAYGLFPTY